MALVGYKVLHVGDKFLKNPYDTVEVTVEAGSPYVGQLVWIYKNSWGANVGDKGFMLHLDEDFHPGCIFYIKGIDDILTEEPESEFIEVNDLDHDGYWNWGISDDAAAPVGACSLERDSDDSENRLGPFDDNYYSRTVKPNMEVDIGSGFSNPDPVHNNGFYFFDQSSCTLSVYIYNPGTAQLNLAQIGTVQIEQASNCFTGPPDSEISKTICMNGSTMFNIVFVANPQNVLYTAKVKIILSPCDADLFEYYEFELVYHGCDLTGEDIYINGYEPWSGYNLIPNDIYIERNGIMEVFGSLAMFEESDIFVEPGGQLIVNGGLITGITGDCKALWYGIDIWGDAEEPQTLDYQGWVQIINGGVIEYAETAIETTNSTDPREYPSGGIITCFNALLRDNVKDVVMNPYTNTHPQSHEIMANFSRFKNTRFETSDDFYQLFQIDPEAHLTLDNVWGIDIDGCTFINSSDRVSYSRGAGILSSSAGYNITSYCPYGNVDPCPELIPCVFENLDYGIRAFNTNTYYAINVDSAFFNNNLRGIYLGVVEHASIIRSTFNVTDPELLWEGAEMVGLYLDAYTTGYRVQENTFIGPSNLSYKTYGIHLLNNGTDQNEIYNNAFTSLYRGIMAVGENRNGEEDDGGLCIKCNDFIDCLNDVIVTPEEDEYGEPIRTVNTGIAKRQGITGNGENDLAAGNTFSGVTSTNYANQEGCGRIDYTYHGDNTTNKILNPDFSGDFWPNPDYNATYSKEESCPSLLNGSINPSDEMNSLLNETNLILAYQDTLDMSVDGGNTEVLNYEVITSLPEEALVLRQDLLNESPYLSDTVMLSAIQNEEVLPAAMVRDILVVNPQAPKSQQVMTSLEQRQDTMPDYMMDEILQGTNVFGAKEILEQKLGDHIAKRSKAWDNLNRFYKNDTTSREAACDSLINLFQNEHQLQAKYNLAFVYLSKLDSIHLFESLDTIPMDFDMTDQQLSIHNEYLDLFDLLWQISSDTTAIDSMQIQSLFGLSASYHTIPGIYASNFLIKEGLLNYYEPVYDINVVKSANADLKQKHGEKIKNLIVFPNPAGNYFIAAYDLTVFRDAGLLTISDIKGRKLKTLHLKDKQNQVVVPVTDLSAGVYVVKLFSGTSLIDSEKITLAK